ncbi:hypothetical protein JTB14_029613 [Gonioctena quinquepunctata]|nr:hypothetical protein JTB14_029613 [Gonioctena quinquepunctata]
MKNRTWNFIEQPENIKAIRTKWVFKTNYNGNGGIDKSKAGIDALGNTQRPGIDFDQTYAPVVQKKTMRMLFAIAAEMDWSIHQMDITAAYLSADLKETVYMDIPEGYDKAYHILREKFPDQFLKSFTTEDGFDCKLNKSIYGLHQSGLMWNKTIKSQGFTRSVADPCVHHEIEEGLIITLHVDDILISGRKKNIECMKKSSNIISNRSLGE